jgi:hypothetical protein
MNTKRQKAKIHPDKRAQGKYSIARFDNGLTPKQRLDTANARLRELEYKREVEKWRTREEAEAIDQETAEIIQGDLYVTLPLSLAGKLSGRSFTPAEVIQVTRAEVDGLVRQWIKGERVPESSIPKEP